MEMFEKLEFKLLQCYRGYDSKDEAVEKCEKYAEELKNYANEGKLDFSNVMKDEWRRYHKTQRYYPPHNI